MQSYLVTGGLGFIGTHLCTKLLDQGHSVYSIDSLENGEYSKRNEKQLVLHSIEHQRNFIQRTMDINSLDTLKLGKMINGVFHLAAMPRVEHTIQEPVITSRNNIMGTVQVLDFCKKHDIPKVVFASSCAVYGSSDDAFTERSKIFPQSPYAIHKAVGEQYMKFYNEYMNVRTASLRMFNVYGTNQDSSHPYALLVPKVLGAIKEGKPIPVFGNGKNSRDYVYVGDVVDAFISAMDNNVIQGDAVNIGSGQSYSVLEVIDIVKKHIGQRDVTIEYKPARIEPRSISSVIDRADKLLGWKPKVTLEEGIKKCIKDTFG